MSISEILAQTSNSLLIMSESDFPFEPLEWQIQIKGELTQKQLLQYLNYPEDTHVEIVSVDDFFKQACIEQEWHTQVEKENAKKFQSLVVALKKYLDQLQVFRLYKTPTNIEVYILGQTTTGEVAGLKTQLVET